MSGYHPGNGLPPDYSHFDEYPEIWAAGGEINERIATVLVHGDVRMLVVRGTKISDEARAILSSGFDLGDGTGQPCLFVGDKPQDDCCVLSRRSMDGVSSPHRTDVTYVQTGRFDRFGGSSARNGQTAAP